MQFVELLANVRFGSMLLKKARDFG